MKKTLANIFAILALLAMLWLPVACSTVTDQGNADPGKSQTDRVERVAKAVGLNAAYFVLENNPDRTDQVAAVADTLDTLAASDGLDLIDLYAAVDRLGLAKIESGHAVLALSNGQLLLEEIGGGTIDLSRLEYSQAFAAGMAAGIRKAIELR